jgi:aldehyde dehydrogenase (NAD+)
MMNMLGLVDVTLSSKLMEEEIFGPILPILRYDSTSEIIDIVRKVGDKPLAMYIFARDKTLIDG